MSEEAICYDRCHVVFERLKRIFSLFGDQCLLLRNIRTNEKEFLRSLDEESVSLEKEHNYSPCEASCRHAKMAINCTLLLQRT